jgi:uncharacterized protein (DUF1501 family)
MSVRSLISAFTVGLLATVAFVAISANAADEQEATVKQLMLGIVIPASDGVFGVASKAPKDDTEWEAIEADAMVLAEAGRLLTQGSRPLDQGDWVKHARELVAASLEAAKYAKAKDVDKTVDAGNAVHDACDSCHMKYMPDRVSR